MTEPKENSRAKGDAICICGHGPEAHRGPWCFGHLKILNKICDCDGFQKKTSFKGYETKPEDETK